MSTFNIGNGVLKSALNQTFLQTQAEGRYYAVELLGTGMGDYPSYVLTCEFEVVVGSPKIKIKSGASLYFVMPSGANITGLQVDAHFAGTLEGMLVEETFETAKNYTVNGTLSINDIIVELTGGIE